MPSQRLPFCQEVAAQINALHNSAAYLRALRTVSMTEWLPKALLLAARTLVPAFADAEDCGRALGALLGCRISQVNLQEALSCAGLETPLELQRASVQQASRLFVKHFDTTRPGPGRQDSALVICQLVDKLLKQKAPWKVAAQIAYAVPAFLAVTGAHSRSPGDSWQQHMQIVWQLFRDSAYSKGMLACTEADRVREQADTALAHCLLSICSEGQQSSCFHLSHGEGLQLLCNQMQPPSVPLATVLAAHAKYVAFVNMRQMIYWSFYWFPLTGFLCT